MKNLVRGVGINDVRGCDERIRYRWRDMIRRTDQRDPRHAELYRQYEDCTLDKRWYRLSAFKEWIEQFDDWENKMLDKDILVPGNKVYGPDTCLMVTPAVNSFFTTKAYNNHLPQGIDDTSNGPKDKPYRATCKFESKLHYGGYHATVEEAMASFKTMKVGFLEVLIERETCPKVKTAMQNIYEAKDSPEIPWW